MKGALYAWHNFTCIESFNPQTTNEFVLDVILFPPSKSINSEMSNLSHGELRVLSKFSDLESKGSGHHRQAV